MKRIVFSVELAPEGRAPVRYEWAVSVHDDEIAAIGVSSIHGDRLAQFERRLFEHLRMNGLLDGTRIGRLHSETFDVDASA